MKRNKIRRVPVTDGARPVGMLSISDVMRVLRSQNGRHQEISHAVIIETLCLISEPSDAGQASDGRHASREAPPHAEARRN
jgi:signal-transduction protein with cAMP-binding, CBS, and nucleotidyltransferase domain